MKKNHHPEVWRKGKWWCPKEVKSLRGGDERLGEVVGEKRKETSWLEHR